MQFKTEDLISGMWMWESKDCFISYDSTIFEPEYRENTLKQLAERLFLSSEVDLDVSYNISSEYLEAAGKMFLYVNLCPKFMFEWTQFYIDLLQNAPPDIIVLSLNRIMVIGKKYGDKAIVDIAKKIFIQIAYKFPFTFPTIDAFTKIQNNTKQNSKGLLDNDINVIAKVANHPIHIVEEHGRMSPSAFIPFCEFGGNMSAMGIKIEQFDVPVCNGFEMKVRHDQLCYEVDLQKFKSDNVKKIEEDLKSGLSFFMDYNEDRQINLEESMKRTDTESLTSKVDGSNEKGNNNDDAFIYINTIGLFLLLIMFGNIFLNIHYRGSAAKG